MLEGGSAGTGLCWEAMAAVPAPQLCCGPGLVPELVRVRGAIPQSLVLPRLTPTSRFLHRIANVGCRWSGTHMGVCDVTSLPHTGTVEGLGRLGARSHAGSRVWRRLPARPCHFHPP